MNSMQRSIIAVVAGLVAWLVWRARPLGIAHARVTAISPGTPPIAHVAVQYVSEARPVSTVVNISGAGCSGSVTIAGITQYADIPLIGIPALPLSVATTAIYRSFGRTVIREQRFE